MNIHWLGIYLGLTIFHKGHWTVTISLLLQGTVSKQLPSSVTSTVYWINLDIFLDIFNIFFYWTNANKYPGQTYLTAQG